MGEIKGGRGARACSCSVNPGSEEKQGCKPEPQVSQDPVCIIREYLLYLGGRNVSLSSHLGEEREPALLTPVLHQLIPWFMQSSSSSGHSREAEMPLEMGPVLPALMLRLCSGAAGW